MCEGVKTCFSCKHFQSFASIYEDALEPYEYGVCENKASPYHWNEGAGEDVTCDFWEEENYE